MRRRAILVLALGGFVVMASSGFGDPGASRYTPRHLPAIIDPKPTLAGWSVDEGDPWIYPLRRPPAFTAIELFGESPTPRDKAKAARLARAGFQVGRHRVWNGERTPRGGAAAVVYAFLFRDVPGARAGFELLRPTGSRERGTKDVASRLGDQSTAWYEPSGSNGNESARFLWRRSNLVVLAQMVCDTECGFAVVPPASAYAGQIDARAKRQS